MTEKKRRIRIPKQKSHRLLLGWALVLGGIFGFLPVVGFWMLPLGITVLSVDLPFARRLRRKVTVWWGRRKSASEKNKQQSE